MEDIGAQLPKVIKTVQDVKGDVFIHQIHPRNLLIEFFFSFGYVVAFETVLAHLKQAKEKINRGITDPNQIFGEKYDVVILAWKNFEEKRKTMTYVEYNP